MHSKTRYLVSKVGKLVCATFLLCISCLYAADEAKPQQVQLTSAKGEGFELTTATTKKQFTPFEPVIVEVILSNVTNETLSLQGFGAKNDYDIRVTDKDDREIPHTRYGELAQFKRVGGGNRRDLILQPRQSDHSYITVNQMFDMSLAGAYKIIIERGGIKKQTGEGRITLASSPVEVEVTGASAFRDAPLP